MACEAPGAMSSSTTRQQRHVVAVSLPGQGHLNPLMRLCQILASHGLLITFVELTQAQPPVHHEAPALSIPDHFDNNIRRARINLANDFRSSSSSEPVFDALNRILAPQLELLILHLNRQGPPITCIIYNIAITVATQNLADKLNIPAIALFPTSASQLLLLYYVMEGVRTSVTTVLEALSRQAGRREVVWAGLPGLPTVYNDELPSFKHVADMWKFLTKSLEESCGHARAIVINSFEDLEAAAFTALSNQLGLPVYGVGPLVKPIQKENSTSLWKEDEGCILWLDQQPALSVLYISFGSIALLSQPQFEEIAAGLLSSQQRFLWVVRPGLLENVENPTALVSDVLVSRAHGRGYVVDWAPQVWVLAHPSVGGFLTHCGWNSTMEAIAHGVPMLCWPCDADQWLNTKYVVEEWKVGLRLEARRNEEGRDDGCGVERGEVERVVKAVMEGEEGRAMRKNAMGLKEAASESQEAGGSSSMQALITSLINV